MKNTWNVTYAIVTPESAEHGDTAEAGFLAEDLSFKDAIGVLRHCGGYVQADCYPVSLESAPRGFTATDDQDYRDGSQESRSLHVPDHVSNYSRIRIARLLGCYGVK